MLKKVYESKDFALEVVSKGETIDATYPDEQWKIETATVRLNNEFFSAWLGHTDSWQLATERNLSAEEFNRCYEELEKEADVINKQHKEIIENQIAKMAGFDGAQNVKQIFSEFFAIARMSKI